MQPSSSLDASCMRSHAATSSSRRSGSHLTRPMTSSISIPFAWGSRAVSRSIANRCDADEQGESQPREQREAPTWDGLGLPADQGGELILEVRPARMAGAAHPAVSRGDAAEPEPGIPHGPGLDVTAARPVPLNRRTGGGMDADRIRDRGANRRVGSRLRDAGDRPLRAAQREVLPGHALGYAVVVQQGGVVELLRLEIDAVEPGKCVTEQPGPVAVPDDQGG